MSKEKAAFICRHLSEDEEMILRDNYFDPEADQDGNAAYRSRLQRAGANFRF